MLASCTLDDVLAAIKGHAIGRARLAGWMAGWMDAWKIRNPLTPDTIYLSGLLAGISPLCRPFCLPAGMNGAPKRL
jgi:hypothetical protein